LSPTRKLLVDEHQDACRLLRSAISNEKRRSIPRHPLPNCWSLADMPLRIGSFKTLLARLREEIGRPGSPCVGCCSQHAIEGRAHAPSPNLDQKGLHADKIGARSAIAYFGMTEQMRGFLSASRMAVVRAHVNSGRRRSSTNRCDALGRQTLATSLELVHRRCSPGFRIVLMQEGHGFSRATCR
jgi:hypothetical protein